MTKQDTAKLKEEKNGVVRPRGTVTGRIWEIADEISAQLKEPAPRRAVMEQAQDENINKSTAATQYGKWCRFHGLSQPRPKKPEEQEVEVSEVDATIVTSE